jgi:hypothetical protein
MKRTFWLALGPLAVLAACSASAAQEKNPPPKANLKKMKETVDRLAMPVTLEIRDAPAKDIISFLIKRAPELTFAWEVENLPDHKVTISAKEEPLGDVLAAILEKGDWSFAVRYYGDLYLYPKPKPKKPQN